MEIYYKDRPEKVFAMVGDNIVERIAMGLEENRTMRQFGTGATRDDDTDKLDFEGFISPLVTKRFAQFMHAHRKQADGTMRGSDNWQSGIPKEAYVKSLVRHMEDVKLHWDGLIDEAVDPDLESVLCSVLFNVQGLLYEILCEKKSGLGSY